MDKITRPPFPEHGSIFGPNQEYFYIGRIGQGTFSTIHKCIDLSYFHHDEHDADPNHHRRHKSNKTKKQRLVAAKVELDSFTTGVLDGESHIHQHLSSSMSKKMVPIFLGYRKFTVESGKSIAAIMMESLRGEDMHQLRSRHFRRLAIPDAVFLCRAILRLLREMHERGVVHRDVKPSNFVRSGTTSNDRNFKVVDFGISKSFIVPKGSKDADLKHQWPTSDGSPVSHCFRMERKVADFRGCSMYASLRVHQLKDYARRDDIWTLLYVFCDLVSGGLPWMDHAGASKERDKARLNCQEMKEYIQGDKNQEPHFEELLKGDEYYHKKFKRDKRIAEMNAMGGYVTEDKLPKLPPPLAMSKDTVKVQALTEAFTHLGKLTYYDKPDYSLIEGCLEKFLPANGSTDETNGPDGKIPRIDWQKPEEDIRTRRERLRKASKIKDDETMPKKEDETSDTIPYLLFEGEDGQKYNDPLEEQMLLAADLKMQEKSGTTPSSGMASDVMRLPLDFQFRLAQVEYNALNHKRVPAHVALRDWMSLANHLLYKPWDSKRYEKHHNGNLYQRNFYKSVLERCLKWAEPFNFFQNRDCFYDPVDADGNRKKRKMHFVATDSIGDLIELSRVLVGLRSSLASEQDRTVAPPPDMAW